MEERFPNVSQHSGVEKEIPGHLKSTHGIMRNNLTNLITFLLRFLSFPKVAKIL